MHQQTVFNTLYQLLVPYLEYLSVTEKSAEYFYANSRLTDDKNKPIFFAMIKAKADQTTFHFMPLYCFPYLLDSISDDLRKQLKGKSCFNFKQINEPLSDELSALLKQGVAAFIDAGKM